MSSLFHDVAHYSQTNPLYETVSLLGLL